MIATQTAVTPKDRDVSISSAADCRGTSSFPCVTYRIMPFFIENLHCVSHVPGSRTTSRQWKSLLENRTLYSAAPKRTFGQKKIPRAKSPKDCTLVHLILRWESNNPRTDSLNNIRQVFWLTDHPTLRSFPSRKDSGFTGFRPRLQRRDRSRF